jgi:putative membrane protein
MNHAKRMLSSPAALLLALGMAACGSGSTNQQANAPSNSQQPSADQYGTASNQGNYSSSSNAPGASSSDTTGPAAPTAPVTNPGATSTLNGSRQPYAQGIPGDQFGAGTSSGGVTKQPPNGTEQQTGQYAPGQGTMGSTEGQMNTQSNAPGSTMTGMSGTSGTTMDVSNLNDAQLAAVVDALNQGEIQAARVAQTRASSPEVKRFATEMVTAHRDMQNHSKAMLTRLQITPSDNAVSNQLKTDSDTSLAGLQGLRGRDFDRMYMDDQVRMHNRALELVDRMIPNAKSPEFKSELQNARMKISTHLQDAERIQSSMQKGTTNPQNQTGK